VEIDLAGRNLAFLGEHNAIADAAWSALCINGGVPGEPADVVLASFPLRASEALEVSGLLAAVRSAAGALAKRPGGGRVVFLVSAVAAMPMRRHPLFSVQMAAVLTTLRGLAMAHGPMVQVNGVGVGAVGDPVVAGEAAMLSHASMGRAGTVAEITDAVLFLCDPVNTYTTGQLLTVDGGWSAGYGRNF
jgi:NAD(P)-dependent dehydrogenase (short-subunit alcohol dehydrogenase family)